MTTGAIRRAKLQSNLLTLLNELIINTNENKDVKYNQKKYSNQLRQTNIECSICVCV